MTVAVVTDSSSCLPATLAAERGIALVPLHVLVDGIDHREGVDDIPEQSTSGKPVTTAGASPGELTEIYAAALERSRGAGVVALHISRGLSSTWEAARQAADHVGSAVRVVDSASAGMGLGFAVLAAAATAAGGAELDEVYRDAVAASTTSRCFIVVDRLDHLRRGGRIGAAAALLGTALAMKPVLHISDGKLVLKEKARTSSKALNKLVDAAVAAATEVGDESGVALAVHHMQCPERAEDVAAMLASRIPHSTSIDVYPFGAVLGAHVGPGAVGVVVAPGRR
ncbi:MULTISPECIES: DegV family protein [Rhodococcus]|jgi:DegV family protein with EDD domain|uniref:DegV family protein n=3 Tax=Rhodococcus TaxID=1827 RepID=A0ABU4B018_9NOCA|nr:MULTISPECIES: DegV family protein [Rhodococcus]KAA0925887.1 DegV family protein [Rhodococcus sp. ANT_H53B]MDI9926302.1 DegV family protein [Rhodococcus sp. IEGM 1341]MDV6231828.1 DegV family protein [Rhodococcus cercidiphylli]MDV6302584.1 DegV family protein [Rhodococcus cerastii]MDV7990798.1 DegV family protein [Rhodococcus sp. IEGM 1374]